MNWKNFADAFTFYGDGNAKRIVENLRQSLTVEEREAIIEFIYDYGYERGHEDGYSEGYDDSESEASEDEDW